MRVEAAQGLQPSREADPKQLPPQPTFPTGWQLGQPDLVVRMPEEFPVPADGPDVYRCFVIPLPIGAVPACSVMPLFS